MKRAGLLHAKEVSSSRGAVDRQQVGFDCGRRSTFPHTHIHRCSLDYYSTLDGGSKMALPLSSFVGSSTFRFKDKLIQVVGRRRLLEVLFCFFILTCWCLSKASDYSLIDSLLWKRPTIFWGKRLRKGSFALLKRPNDNFVFPVFFCDSNLFPDICFWAKFWRQRDGLSLGEFPLILSSSRKISGMISAAA